MSTICFGTSESIGRCSFQFMGVLDPRAYNATSVVIEMHGKRNFYKMIGHSPFSPINHLHGNPKLVINFYS